MHLPIFSLVSTQVEVSSGGLIALMQGLTAFSNSVFFSLLQGTTMGPFDLPQPCKTEAIPTRKTQTKHLAILTLGAIAQRENEEQYVAA